MHQFNFISGTQKVLDTAPFLSMKFGTVSESRAMPCTMYVDGDIDVRWNRPCGVYLSQTTNTREETAI